ncbi:MAG: GHMP family kinase ATP-binding protein [Tepidisphaeraceae bacterium]
MNPRPELINLEPAPTLLRRCRAELGASFAADRPVRISRAPGRLDVMGGIIDTTGGLCCSATLDRATAVALQGREDRVVQIFSFNLFDAHRPFTLMVPLEGLAHSSIDQLRHGFAEEGRHWSAVIAGCLAVLHEERLLDLTDPAVRGVNLAVLTDVPAGAGVGSSAATAGATLLNLIDHYLPAESHGIEPGRVAAMAQRVEQQIAGQSGTLTQHQGCCLGQARAVLRIDTQSGALLGPLYLPGGVRVIGINSGAPAKGLTVANARVRCAAVMGHRMILDKMKQMGATLGRQMIGDPMQGFLANLALNDYKKYFRPYLPEKVKGGQFLLQFGGTIPRGTSVEPDFNYPVQSATDHHVFEAHRVKEFVRYLEAARDLQSQDPQRKLTLDKAGHLMYASHISSTKDAGLGHDACDLLVDLIRQSEADGFYGARITAGGCGGTVAVLCDAGPGVDEAVGRIQRAYEAKTGLTSEAFLASTPGAWAAGTVVV